MNIDVLARGITKDHATMYDQFGIAVKIGDIIAITHKRDETFAFGIVAAYEKTGGVRIVPIDKTKPSWLSTDYRFSAKVPMNRPVLIVTELIKNNDRTLYENAKNYLETFSQLEKKGRVKTQSIVIMKPMENNEFSMFKKDISFFTAEECKNKIDKIIETYKDNHELYILNSKNEFVLIKEFYNSKQKCGLVAPSICWVYDEQDEQYAPVYRFNNRVLEKTGWKPSTWYECNFGFYYESGRNLYNALYKFIHRNEN